MACLTSLVAVSEQGKKKERYGRNLEEGWSEGKDSFLSTNEEETPISCGGGGDAGGGGDRDGGGGGDVFGVRVQRGGDKSLKRFTKQYLFVCFSTVCFSHYFLNYFYL